MKKHLVSSFLFFTIIVFSPLIGSINIAHADSRGPIAPSCSAASGNQPATCSLIPVTYTIDGLDALHNIVYVYRDTSANALSLLTTSTDKISTDTMNNWYYYAFAKNQLQSATGSLDPLDSASLSKIGKIEDNFMSTRIAKVTGLMQFVISKNDDLLSGAGDLSNYISSGGFFSLYMTHPDPFIQVPITDPRKKEDLFYSPLGIYGGNDIVLYKSKEIQTLDDGSKKTITLPPPSIEGVVPFTGASGTPASASHSWWSGFWCFIKGIFGKSC